MSAQATQTRTIRTAAVYTHRRPEVTSDVLRTLLEEAERAGVELRFDPDETAKHQLEGRPAAGKHEQVAVLRSGGSVGK